MEVTSICSCKLSPGAGVTEGGELLHVGTGSHSGPRLEPSITSSLLFIVSPAPWDSSSSVLIHCLLKGSFFTVIKHCITTSPILCSSSPFVPAHRFPGPYRMQVSPTSALHLSSTLVASEFKTKLTITKDNGTFIAFELNHLLTSSVLNPINFSGAIPHGGGGGRKGSL